MGDARLFLSEDTGHVRRVQTSHRLLSHAVSSESLREGSFEICHGQRVDPVSSGKAATSTSDPQDHRVPRSREYRGRQKMENVTEPVNCRIPECCASFLDSMFRSRSVSAFGGACSEDRNPSGSATTRSTGYESVGFRDRFARNGSSHVRKGVMARPDVPIQGLHQLIEAIREDGRQTRTPPRSDLRAAAREMPSSRSDPFGPAAMLTGLGIRESLSSISQPQ